MYLHALCVLLFLFSVSDCVDVPIAAGAAAASFIGGVLLTATIAAAVAGAIMCRPKRKVPHNLVHTWAKIYCVSNDHGYLGTNPYNIIHNDERDHKRESDGRWFQLSLFEDLIIDQNMPYVNYEMAKEAGKDGSTYSLEHERTLIDAGANDHF